MVTLWFIGLPNTQHHFVFLHLLSRYKDIVVYNNIRQPYYFNTSLSFQFAFIDSSADLHNRNRSLFYLTYPQFFLVVRKLQFPCYNPAHRTYNSGERQRVCYVQWTGPLREGDTVYIEKSVKRWKSHRDSSLSYMGVVLLATT